MAIRDDEPVPVDRLIAEPELLPGAKRHRRIPEELNAEMFSPLDKPLVQPCAAHPKSMPARKHGGSSLCCAMETDPLNGESVFLAQVDAELCHGGDGIRHQTFAAGLVYRRVLPIEDGAGKTALLECNGGGESGGAATHDCDLKVRLAIHCTFPATIMLSALLFETSRRAARRNQN